jgi:hypothetical protein
MIIPSLETAQSVEREIPKLPETQSGAYRQEPTIGSQMLSTARAA